jgi:fructokinase
MQLIVVTHGEGGATAYTRSGHVHAPGFKVATIDTTGAGDAFVAGLHVGILEHGDSYLVHLPQIIRFANAVGALTTTGRGGGASMPTRAAVEALLKD